MRTENPNQDLQATALRIRLTGELDLAAADRVDRELRQAQASNPKEIVVELDELEFLDSRGAEVLVNAGGRSAATGSRLRLTGSPLPQVRRLLELTRLDQLLRFDG